MNLRANFIEALLKEIELRKNYIQNSEIKTIYFGGGTPSLLSEEELNIIFNHLHHHFIISPTSEITLEANPDDLTSDKIKMFQKSPINRFSMGVQSFFDADLQLMNRAHNANEAHTSIKKAQDAGFNNISIDLIYGTPTLSHQNWYKNLETTFALNIPHVSAYCLTVEPKTALEHLIKKGKIAPVDEQKSAEQMAILINEMKKNDYEHYEVSNFCKNGQISRHNSSYWQNRPYLGLGPSAHSFNLTSRQWNVANNAKYVKSILQENKVPFEVEILSKNEQFNEYVMIGLRTKWGVNLSVIKERFGEKYVEDFKKKAKFYVEEEKMVVEDETFRLTSSGLLLADGIAGEFFV